MLDMHFSQLIGKILLGIQLLGSVTYCKADDFSNDTSQGLAGIPSNPIQKIEGHIIGGQKALSGQFPWQVMLLRDLDFNCGGSLISAQWVLTAAHCVEEEGDFAVRLGTLNKDDFELNRVQMDIPPGNIFIHEYYNPTLILNDVALIKLPIALQLPKKTADQFYINSIRLPKRTEVSRTYDGKMVAASGWGRTDPENSEIYSPDLKWVSLPVMPNAKCKETFGNLQNSNICADTNNSNGTCNGDSGGPLVVKGKDNRFTLIGVSSYVAGKTCLGGPAAFAKVSSYLDWIKKTSGLRV